MTGSLPAPVLMIALDAAEGELIERGIRDGSMPNLQRLASLGSYARLESTADLLAGSPWPTFYTGVSPSEHGLYHFLQWQAESMTSERPRADSFPLRPFWRDLGDAGRRCIVLDIPMTFAPQAFNGIEISGWSTHDHLAPPASHPPEMLSWVQQSFGACPLGEEVYGSQPAKALMALRDELVTSTQAVANLAVSLIKREPWNLFLVGFGATHRGGHRLWDLSGTRGTPSAAEREQLSRSLQDVYTACDAAVGQLIDSAPKDATVIVFSLHGMGPNSSRGQLLPSMLSRVLEGPGHDVPTSSRASLMRRLLARVPLEWKLWAKRRLPSAIQDRLTRSYLMGEMDWASTKAFCLIADLQGYIRISLRGRERSGTVDCGEEFHRLCQRLEDGLVTFVDPQTSEPIVERVVRTSDCFPPGSRRSALPDLIVCWSHTPAANQTSIESSLYGSIPWPTPGSNGDGRSGNHRPEAFIIAAGEPFKPGSTMPKAHILDLAPSIFQLLGVPVPASMMGKILEPLRGGAL